MERYYLKNRDSKEIVTATFDANEEGDWTILDFDGEQPYFGSKEELERIRLGLCNDSWSYEISKFVKLAIKLELLDIIEVEL